MKVLIDTCIIIDALQSRKPFNKDAEDIFFAVACRKFLGYITANSITDISYLINRNIKGVDSRKILASLFELFGILDTTGIDCQKALNSIIDDYEDAVMNETAIREDIDCIVTRNVKDYKNSSIKVLTPNDFLKLFEE